MQRLYVIRQLSDIDAWKEVVVVEPTPTECGLWDEQRHRTGLWLPFIYFVADDIVVVDWLRGVELKSSLSISNPSVPSSN